MARLWVSRDAGDNPNYEVWFGGKPEFIVSEQNFPVSFSSVKAVEEWLERQKKGQNGYYTDADRSDLYYIVVCADSWKALGFPVLEPGQIKKLNITIS